MNEASKGTPVKVKFATEIKRGLEKEHVAFEANGLYYIKDTASYLTFDETINHTAIKTTLKISSEEILIMRSGEALAMQQKFRRKERTTGLYQTQFGRFDMVTDTENIEYQWNEKSGRGRLFVTYLMQLQGDREGMGRHSMTIHFKEEKQ